MPASATRGVFDGQFSDENRLDISAVGSEAALNSVIRGHGENNGPDAAWTDCPAHSGEGTMCKATDILSALSLSRVFGRLGCGGTCADTLASRFEDATEIRAETSENRADPLTGRANVIDGSDMNVDATPQEQKTMMVADKCAAIRSPLGQSSGTSPCRLKED